MLMDRQTDKKWTNEQNNTNFKRNLAMMVIYISIKFEFDWTKRSRVEESGNGNVEGQTNGQKTDKRTGGITPILKGT